MTELYGTKMSFMTDPDWVAKKYIPLLNVLPFQQFTVRELVTQPHPRTQTRIQWTNKKVQKLSESAYPDAQRTAYRDYILPDETYAIRTTLTEKFIQDSAEAEIDAEIQGDVRAINSNIVEQIVKNLGRSITATSGEASFGWFGGEDQNHINGDGSKINLNLPFKVGSKEWTAVSQHNGSGSQKLDVSSDYANATGETNNKGSIGGHVWRSGNATITLADISEAKLHISEHGASANLLFISPKIAKQITDLGDWTSALTPNAIIEKMAIDGVEHIGKISGLQVIESVWLYENQIVVIATNEVGGKPLGFNEVQTPTYVEGTGMYKIRDAMISHRFGVKVIRPWQGVSIEISA